MTDRGPRGPTAAERKDEELQDLCDALSNQNEGEIRRHLGRLLVADPVWLNLALATALKPLEALRTAADGVLEEWMDTPYGLVPDPIRKLRDAVH